MVLEIDTSSKKNIKLALISQKMRKEHEFAAPFSQAERLLPEIKRFLKDNQVNLADIKEIVVNNEGSSFTSLRIGVTTANALAFALSIPVRAMNNEKSGNYVAPQYDREPNITVKNDK